MLRVKEISSGNLNINVAFSVLGLYTKGERDQYLYDLHIFIIEKIMCMKMLVGKNGSHRLCSRRVMRGKNMCSYHARNLRFRARAK